MPWRRLPIGHPSRLTKMTDLNGGMRRPESVRLFLFSGGAGWTDRRMV